MIANRKNQARQEGLIQANATQLRELHDAIHVTYARRKEGDAQCMAWEEACRRFHALYDRLAFPGGISEAMALLAKSDTNTTEMVVRFLEADPWYFRSGYHKADMLKQLRRVALEDGQRKRLQQVIISRIQDRETPREFRWYCRLAPYVSDIDFERHISEVAKSADSIQSWHAAWVLERLKSSPKKPTRKKH